ncbi:hypothetical protein [Flavobacterium reichenbachii]|uniref:Lipoprotein n=1 Tax=Flavobacterium reichenbachii TaxID=362418 RepID=A0A085ZQ11_9FLAO|nr:hypothetical protein [Flavobacterium reichenbachii]KFF06525.1 hypothetical protein IW19_13860 [Flavobacterium reichenbachii]OXB10999.1 hypothetical protein B0A68_21440 [Flavobacterium reichenbachii]
MKYLSAFLLFILFAGCQITETLTINRDGSGDLEVVQLRDENSYMQIAFEQYSKENIFQDTTYVFKEYIEKYNENFLKYQPEEKQLFQKYANVKVHLKKSSFEKEFRNVLSLQFDQVSEIPDLYKTENYASDIEHNYALTAENHYYKIGYDFDGKIFKRSVLITTTAELEKTKEECKRFENKYGALKLLQSYVLKYHFPRKIKSVSNEKAILSSDKKSLTIEFQLSAFSQNPADTNLEVVLE